MLCSNCRAEDASVFIRRSLARDKSDVALCESCARARGIVAGEGRLDLRLDEILGGALAEAAGRESLFPADQSAARCPFCGLDRPAFLREGRLGCAQCADVFRSELDRLLARRAAGRVLSSAATPSPEGACRADIEAIALRGRIRLFRNLADMAFPGSPRGGRSPSAALLRQAFSSLPGWELKTMGGLGAPRARSLIERGLASRAFASESSSLIAEERSPLAGEGLVALIDEREHLCLISESPLLSLGESLASLNATLASLGASFPFARDPDIGWLCCRAEDCGPGLEIAVLTALPALTALSRHERPLRSLLSEGLAVRGFYSDGEASAGALYEIVASSAADADAEQMIARIRRAMTALAIAESGAREKITDKEGKSLADSAGRAYGIISHCVMMGEDEANGLVSTLRLAALCGLVSGLDLKSSAALAGRLGDASVALRAGRTMLPGAAESEELRAAELRSVFSRAKLEEKF